MKPSKRKRKLIAYGRSKLNREKVHDQVQAAKLRAAYKENPDIPLTREAFRVLRKNKLRAATEALDGRPEIKPLRISGDDHQQGVFRG